MGFGMTDKPYKPIKRGNANNPPPDTPPSLTPPEEPDITSFYGSKEDTEELERILEARGKK